VIALDVNHIGTGSGRSILGVDIGQAVRRAVAEGLLIKGGGHAMAAGVTVARDRIGALRAFLEEALAADVATARRDDSLLIDGAVSAAAATPDLVATIARAGPFGAGNSEPILALPSHTIAYAEVVGQAHVRARLRAKDGSVLAAVAFRAANRPLGDALIANRGQPVHAAGTLCIDRWQGAERAQMQICDVAVGGGPVP
jgi:single-stranded-DNA-specific exonuclease